MKRHFAYLGIEEVIEAEDSYDKFEEAFLHINLIFFIRFVCLFFHFSLTKQNRPIFSC